MSLNKVIVVFLIILLIFSGIIFFQFFYAGGPKTKVTIDKQIFLTTVAKTPTEMEKGLSDRKSLPQNQAMLFLLQVSGDHPFWMKNMEFPIDIIFINGDKIISISENAKIPATPDENLPLYRSTQPADKALEINAGLSKKYGFKAGDTVKIELDQTKK